MYAPLTMLLECELYMQHTLLVGSADPCLREIMHYELCIHEWSALFPTNEAVLQVLQAIRNNKTLKEG